MLAIVKGKSIVRIPRGLEVLVIGRIKLSEICNIDQTPLLFEYLKGRTYEKTRARTVSLKGGKSGHNKRQCTLQVTVFTDRVPCCKPLLMFKGKPRLGDSRRRAKRKQYYPGVVVIFNEKAYANTSNLIN